MPKSFLVKNRLGVRVSESEHIFIRKGQAMSKGDIADMTLGIQYENHGDHGLKSWATFISKQQYAATTSRDSSPSEPQIRSFKDKTMANTSKDENAINKTKIITNVRSDIPCISDIEPIDYSMSVSKSISTNNYSSIAPTIETLLYNKANSLSDHNVFAYNPMVKPFHESTLPSTFVTTSFVTRTPCLSNVNQYEGQPFAMPLSLCSPTSTHPVNCSMVLPKALQIKSNELQDDFFHHESCSTSFGDQANRPPSELSNVRYRNNDIGKRPSSKDVWCDATPITDVFRCSLSAYHGVRPANVEPFHYVNNRKSNDGLSFDYVNDLNSHAYGSSTHVLNRKNKFLKRENFKFLLESTKLKLETVNNGTGLRNPLFHKRIVNNEILVDESSIWQNGISLVKYQCAVCGLLFENDSAFNRHKKSHKELKRYLCVWCSKGFNDTFDLKRHTRIHTGVRPFKCDSCTKSFSQRCSLESHCKKIHGQTQPFAFNERRTKLYICEKCGYSTTDICEYMKHVSSLHGEPSVQVHDT